MTPQLLDSALLSLEVASLSVLLAVPLALVLATAIFRTRWRVLEALLLLPLFLPPTVVGFVLLWCFSPNHAVGQALKSLGIETVFTPVGTILACVVVSFPLAFQTLMVGLAKVPRQSVEGGFVLGGDFVLNTFRVVWPQMKGAVAVACLLVFARALGEFGASILVGGNIAGLTQTLPLAVYSLAETGQFLAAGTAAALSAILGLLVYGALRWAEVKA